MGRKTIVLLVTVTPEETKAVREIFEATTGHITRPKTKRGKIYHELGEVNGTRVVQVLSQMGSGELGAAQQAVDRAISELWPSAIIGVGIAFGMDPGRQRIGDVLVSRQLGLYDSERVGTDGEGKPSRIHRGDTPHASTRLIEYFASAASYAQELNVQFGLLVSGEKLVDYLPFRQQLQEAFPEAKGGDMEAKGIYVACQPHSIDWIVIKGISDWGDGHKGINKAENQKLAAGNAATFLLRSLKHVRLQLPVPGDRKTTSTAPRLRRREIRTASPFEQSIEQFRGLLRAQLYDEAFAFFRQTLNFELDFIRSDNHTYLNLILELFLHKPDSDPPLASAEARAAALNFLGRAYKNIGKPTRAVGIYQRQMKIESGNSTQRVMCLANLTNALRITGKLQEASLFAREMLREARTLEPVWQAYGLYWNGVLQAGIGQTRDGVHLLREAQVLFEDVAEGSSEGECAAGIGRAYAHLAQIELWLGNPSGALTFAQHAQKLVEQHNQHRERIFATRLIGSACLLLADFPSSGKALREALELARKCHYFEEELAATIGLAELSRHEGKLPLARQLLTGELGDHPEIKDYALLMSDFYNTLCSVYRNESGRDPDALDAAKKAYAFAWCDGPPYCYYWGLEQARKHLTALGEPPTGASLDKPSSLISRDGILNQEELTRSELRGEFTTFLRTVNSSYRYAPTKFIKILGESWNAIRDIAAHKHCDVSPQFIEIHISEPCNLSCLYCRGELRVVPSKQRFLSREVIHRLIAQISELNRRAFIRISGLIGEPLVHPHFVDILEMLNGSGLSWGLTTNGIEMKGERLRTALLRAKYVHISVDSGTAETYRHLKDGKVGDFETVMQNISSLIAEKLKLRQGPEVVISFLLREENYKELPELASRVKAMRADSLEIKMQHFDLRSIMSKRAIDEAYEYIGQIQSHLSSAHFRVVVVQDRNQAFGKISGRDDISFERCYANLLGLNATVDAGGQVHMCCQYYQSMLGQIGSINSDDLASLWSGDRRRAALIGNPKEHCVGCSPSDEFINRFVQFLKDAQQKDDRFLDWVEAEAFIGTRHLAPSPAVERFYKQKSQSC